MADFLRANEAKLLDRWYEIVFAASRGRASAEEVRTELGDFYGLVVRAMSGADELAMRRAEGCSCGPVPVPGAKRVLAE